MKEFLIKDTPSFKMRVRINSCLSPVNLKHIEFINEQYNDENELTASSAYQYFITEAELISLCNQMLLKS